MRGVLERGDRVLIARPLTLASLRGQIVGITDTPQHGRRYMVVPDIEPQRWLVLTADDIRAEQAGGHRG